MKNNRKNRKLVAMYFKNMNRRYGLKGSLEIVPVMLYSKGKKRFSAMIGSVNNPRSEIMTRPPRSVY
jgi:hypothetical protein